MVERDGGGRDGTTRRSFLQFCGVGAAALSLGATPSCGASASLLQAMPGAVLPPGRGGVILMGWDGAGWNNVGPMLDAGLLPNLQALIGGGAHILPLELIGRTNTLTTWSQVFTGLTYDLTGVTGNYKGLGSKEPVVPEPPFPEINFWIKEIPYAWTVPSQARASGVRVGWITSKRFLGDDALQTPLAEVARRAETFLMSSPKDGGTDAYIDELTGAAEEFVRPGGAYFLFFHVDPDYYGHRYGEASERYRYEFVRADAALGRIRAAAPDAHILVMADHGFDKGEKYHYNAPDAWAVTTLPVHTDYFLDPGQRARATPRDVGTMLLDIYGADLGSRVPQIRGKPLLA